MILEHSIKMVVEAADDNIVELISECVPLKKKGVEHEGKCPFHNERTGSFKVNATKRIWHCFGCGVGGRAIDFLAKFHHISFMKAIEMVSKRYNITLQEVGKKTKDEENELREYIPAVKKFTYKTKEFSSLELQLLGNKRTYDVDKDGNNIVTNTHTQEFLESKFSLYSLEYYIEPPYEGSTTSRKYKSSDSFPIMAYIYKEQDENGEEYEWAKIYTPLSLKSRFKHIGRKKKGELSDKFFMCADAREAVNRSKHAAAGEGEGGIKAKRIIIYSGGSDAINGKILATKIKKDGEEIRSYAAWPNSETAVFTYAQIEELTKAFTQVCICYDLDDTGLRFALEMALKHLDLHIINLPADMYTKSNGRFKDVKDYNMYYNVEGRSKHDDWLLLQSTALSLKFWQPKRDKDGNVTGYDIDNENMYNFLAARGLYIYNDEQAERFVQMRGNRVESINPDKLKATVNETLCNFVRGDIKYYNKQIINTIHRSAQTKGESLKNMRYVNLDIYRGDKNNEYMYFRNGALRITADKMELVPYSRIPGHVLEEKVIQHDIVLPKDDTPFEINYTPQAAEMQKRLRTLDTKSAEYISLQAEYDAIPCTEKYSLKMHWGDFSYLRYLYNVGRVHWQKEENGEALTDLEQAEHDLHFISKVMAAGYLLSKHKEMSRSYAVYGMENDIIALGKHQGGTGKSLFFFSLGNATQTLTKEGQTLDAERKPESLYMNVKRNVTDIVYFDDLKKDVKMRLFFTPITGPMIVRNLYENPIEIPFDESPRICFTSNHSPSDLEGSTRRRVWVIGFSSYYHPKDRFTGQQERSPRSEFGKELFTNYDEKEKNTAYLVFAHCLQNWMKFREKVEPPMENIESRTLLNEIGPVFHDWANDFFSDGAEDKKCNVLLNRTELFNHFRDENQKAAGAMTPSKFRDKLEKFCQLNDWQLNPAEIFRNDTERTRREYKRSVDGKSVMCFLVQTRTFDTDDIERLRDENPITLSDHIAEYRSASNQAGSFKKTGQMNSYHDEDKSEAPF